MATLASDVILSAAALVGDPSQAVATNDKTLPYLKIANEDLQLALAARGIPTVREETAALTVNALATTLASQPADLIQPIELHEKTPSSNENWMLMKRETWTPDEQQTSLLRYWVWRENVISFLGATAARSVRVRYIKPINPITGTGTAIALESAVQYLKFRTAALLAFHLLESPSRADACEAQAERALDKCLTVEVKGLQNNPVRRKRYTWNGER